MRILLREHGTELLFLLAVISCLTTVVDASAAVPGTTSPPPATITTSTAVDSSVEGKNPVLQMLGYVKDSAIRAVDGTKEMWGNHGRCKEIRHKQKDYRAKLQKQWELQEKGLSRKEMQERLRKTNGGITYDEFVFLSKGREDRGKVMNMMFLMFGASRLFPYVIMFYPDILPSAFAPLPDASGRETKLEQISRQRAHAVIQAMISLEKQAKSVPSLSKINIFGRKKQERNMVALDEMGQTAGAILTTPSARGGAGAKLLLDSMDSSLYSPEEWLRGPRRLVGVPKAVVAGLGAAIGGPAPFSSLLPNAMRRGTVFAHIQKVAEADYFLVNERVDLDSLSTARLLEACNDRLIGSLDRTDDELRQNLSEWLNMAVIAPAERQQRSGEHFNENLARAALMGYYALDATRESSCTSYLPRLAFHPNQP